MGKKKTSRKELETAVRLQQETLSKLWLLVGSNEFAHLSNEQKDCVADAVDEFDRRPGGFKLVERWWWD